MLNRCRNPNVRCFHNYGGRGIKVCERWWKFTNFFEDMGRKPTMTHTLERIDNNGNYEPSNCKWETRFKQARNTRWNKFVTFNGKTLCHADWDIELGFPKYAVTRRLWLGWSVEKALTQPLKKYPNK